MLDAKKEPKKHARRSPSGSKRWINCPGSLRMEDGLPDKSTIYSIEGTAAHTVAEQMLRFPGSEKKLLGQKVNGVEVTADMIEHLMVYVNWVRFEVDQRHDWWLEQRVDIDVTGEGGTADAIIYKHDEQLLVVGDLKYGQGVIVDVVDNTQAILYALGALKMLPKSKPVKKIRVVIIQPRAQNGETISEWEFPIEEMLDWKLLFMAAVEAGNDPNAPLKAGDWCTFCKARAACPELQNKALSNAMADFSSKGELVVSPPNTLTPKKLAKALEAAATVKIWIKAVHDYAMDEAKAGRLPPGWKLVDTRAYRKFKNSKSAESYLSFMGLTDDQLYNPREMKTVPQLEKSIGKQALADIEHLFDKRSGGVALAPVSDKRPAVMPDATTEFSTIEED